MFERTKQLFQPLFGKPKFMKNVAGHVGRIKREMVEAREAVLAYRAAPSPARAERATAALERILILLAGETPEKTTLAAVDFGTTTGRALTEGTETP